MFILAAIIMVGGKIISILISLKDSNIDTSYSLAEKCKDGLSILPLSVIILCM